MITRTLKTHLLRWQVGTSSPAQAPGKPAALMGSGLDRQRRWQTPSMGSSLAKEIEALETTEHVIAALMLSPERDEVIDRLIAAIEQDRAEILASMIGGQALNREPLHLRRDRRFFRGTGSHAVARRTANRPHPRPGRRRRRAACGVASPDRFARLDQDPE
jgi:hypothetical protein